VPRPTKEQIDEEILDCAATLFARHGFRETSVQRIADAVGYSKTGLLHRYPSKEALQEAVVARCIAEMQAVAADVAGQPAGPDRDRAAITAMAHNAIARPGFVALLLSSLVTGPDGEVATALKPGYAAILEIFGLPAELADAAPDGAGLERVTRVTGALGALAVVRVALREHPPADLVGHLVDVSWRALGHPAPTTP
jgi:AcrR family transcriptional regulator